MRRLVTIIGLFFSLSCFCDVGKNDVYKLTLSNGIEVVLYENFNFPIVRIGVIYDVGSLDAIKGKCCIGEIASHLFLDPKTKAHLRENGINYYVDVRKTYTEFVLTTHPQHLDKALECIAMRNAVVNDKDVSYLQQQLLVSNKLREINELDAIKNLRYGLLFENTTDLIFNKNELMSLTHTDVSAFLKKYDTCNIRIIVCGSVSYKRLMKLMRASIYHMSRCNHLRSRCCNARNFKTAYIEGKFRTNAMHLYFMRTIPFGKAHAYLDILNALIEDHLMGEYPYVCDYYLSKYSTPAYPLQMILLLPKKDVSLRELQKMWEVFLSNITKDNLSDEYIKNVAQRRKTIESFNKVNLECMYELIKNALQNDIDISEIFASVSAIEKMTPDEFKNISAEIFEKNPLLKIIEQYRVTQ